MRHSCPCRLLPFLALALLVTAHRPGFRRAPAAAAKQTPPGELKWFRGNTHAHTTLCGHADSTPEIVAQWYLDHGYHFLCLSEHNQFIDPATVKLPDGRRDDFILVPGEEITAEQVHMTGLNLSKLVGWVFNGPGSKAIDTFGRWTRDVGGVPIINHPNFQWKLSVDDIRPVNTVRLFELFNGHPSVNNEGDATRPSTERLWDILLTDGMVMYGVSSDDAHHFQTIGPQHSNAGRGWVMVRAAELTPRAVSEALDRGDFYASNGVMLGEVTVTDAEYRVVVDRAATEAEVVKPEVLGDRSAAAPAPKAGCRINFIGPKGALLGSFEGFEGAHSLEGAPAYVRAKVSYTREVDGVAVSYYAWTQPVFRDGRLGAGGK